MRLVGIALVSLAMVLGMAFLTFLAGGAEPIDPNFLFVFWPVAIFIAMIALVVDNVFRSRERKDKFLFWRPGWLTSLWLSFYFAPVICNALSKICWLLGWEKGAEAVFRYRWQVWPVVIGTICVIGFLFGLVDLGKTGWDRFKRCWSRRTAP